MANKFNDLLKEAFELVEADDDLKMGSGGDEDPEVDDIDDDEDTDEDKGDDEDVTPDSEADYTPEDFREIIDYVYDILDKEDDGELNESIGEIGLDLLYDYAEALPQTVINQIVADLKEVFEIEDTMLESIVTEGAAFVKSKKGSIAKALQKKAKKFYKANKNKVKANNTKWRKSAVGKKILAFHKKALKQFGKKKKLVGATETAE